MIDALILRRTTTTFRTAVLENLNRPVKSITFRHQKGNNLVSWHKRYAITMMLESGNIREGSEPSRENPKMMFRSFTVACAQTASPIRTEISSLEQRTRMMRLYLSSSLVSRII